MTNNDVQLIHRILSGDDEAFSILMQKHQKGVHALIWRKIGDFQIAEEITQDTFIQVYKKLGTLSDPNRFSGWLYVIANRLCINWIQRNKAKLDRLNMQSLENTHPDEIEEASRLHHIAHEQETEAENRRQKLVKTLLEKLPESERTVVTLYYLGEMTTKEIGRFLGVSMNTIKSRLRRARKRLQEEEILVRETLGGVQLSESVTENVMRHIADLKPTPTPPAKKPLLPWASFGAAVVLAIFLGVSSQYLFRFQQPYSFDAKSEPTIELVDEPILLEIVAKPAVRNRIGRAISPTKNSGTSMQTLESRPSENAWDTAKFSTSPWTQSIGPEGSIVSNLFKASDGTIYAATKTGLYKLTSDATWALINTEIPSHQSHVPIAEHRGTLYAVSTDEVFASENAGETWATIGQRPKGTASGLIVTDTSQKQAPHTQITLYLALKEKGVFRSTDAGNHWTPLNNGLRGTRTYTIGAIGNTLFAGTNQGLHRLRSNDWQHLLTEVPGAVYTLTVNANNLYVAITRDFDFSGIDKPYSLGNFLLKRIFHSADAGASWTEITPTDESQLMDLDAAVQILAVGKTLLMLGISEFRSTDGGKTWTPLRSNTDVLGRTTFPAVVIDENTFYKVDASGISRTTDAGESWHPFVNGMTGPTMRNLIAINQRLYMHIGADIVQSIDGGQTWESVRFNTQEQPLELDETFYSRIKLTTDNNVLYAISIDEGKPSIFRISTAGDEFIEVQDVPAFEIEPPIIEAETDDEDIATHLLNLLRKKRATVGDFVVSDRTFYTEYQKHLFKWEPGTPQWTDIGFVDIDPKSILAISAETFYAGKSNGKLFQSLDSGDSWKDITSTLPMNFTHFKDIIFLGSTVYIATDKGVLVSKTGEHWRVITDKNRTRTVIGKFAAAGTTIYGVGDTGAYRLDALGKWELLSSEIPNSMIVSVVISDNRLYIGTYDQGMFHISLENQINIANSF